MTGDQADFVRRLRDVLPVGWFSDTAPVLETVLSGVARSWADFHTLLTYVRRQTRISTASETWLDAVANDYFGYRLRRRSGQADDAFRRQVLAEILREKGTRTAVSAVLADLTGRLPVIFEPAHCGDTGSYGGSPAGSAGAGYGFAYGRAGGWGNLNLPFQFFITAYRPERDPTVSGLGWGSGGYSSGFSSYADIEAVRGGITDADINKAVAGVLPISSVAWTRIVG